MKQGGARKWMAAFLAVSLLLGLTACNKQEEDNTPSGTVYVPTYVPCDLDLDYARDNCCDGTYLYMVGSQETMVMRNSLGEIVRTLDDENLDWDSLNSEFEQGYYVDYLTDYQLYRVNLADGASEMLPDFVPPTIPEGAEGNASVNRMWLDTDGSLWVKENISSYVFDLPEDFDPTNDDRWNYRTDESDVTVLCRLDKNGKELSRIDITSLTESGEEENYTYLNGITACGGVIYALISSYDEEAETELMKITALDESKNVLFTLDCPEQSWGSLVQLPGGAVGYMGNRPKDTDSSTSSGGMRIATTSVMRTAASSVMIDSAASGGTSRYLQLIDPETKDWGTEYPLPYNCYSIYPGGGRFLFYYSINETVYGYNPETMQGEKLLTWSSADINSNYLQFYTFLEDGRILALSQNWGENGNRANYELALLTETDAAILPPKTTLTYASIYVSYSDRNKIIDFNKSSDTHRIEILDYSQFNTETDSSAGLTQLNTDIGAGKVPDILSTRELPVSRYGGAGVLEDLWPFIENDPDLGREKVMEHVLEAAEQDGKLYIAFPSFTINTLVGAKDVVGDRMSWTLADMQAALATMPEGCSYLDAEYTKDQMLSSILEQNLDSYIDWTTGQCSFNTPDFISALEFCNSFAAEFDWENVDWETYKDSDTRIREGMQMLATMSVYSLSDLQYQKARFNGDVSFIGFPREDGGAGSAFELGAGLCMSSTCEDKDGAWQFIRDMFLPQYADVSDEDYYGGGSFSVNKQDFDQAMTYYMTPRYEKDENGNPVLDENGNPVEEKTNWFWIDGEEIPIYAATQADYDQVMALYNSTDHVYSQDTEIMDIVKDVTAGFFNGDKTAQETAGQIQDRVGLYVGELH